MTRAARSGLEAPPGSVALKGMPPLWGWSLPASKVGPPSIVVSLEVDFLVFILAFSDLGHGELGYRLVLRVPVPRGDRSQAASPRPVPHEVSRPPRSERDLGRMSPGYVDGGVFRFLFSVGRF